MTEDIPAEMPPKEVKFSWLRIGKIVLIIVVLAAAFAGIYFIANLNKVKATWADWVLNRHEHYLTCYDLPFYPQVEKSLKAHSDIAEKVKQLGAGEVTAERLPCKGWDMGVEFIKGDILITYQSRAQKDNIEKAIGDNFFGVPYIGHPVK